MKWMKSFWSTPSICKVELIEEENIHQRVKRLERNCCILGICNILLVISGIRLVFSLRNVYEILTSLTDALIISMKALEQLYKMIELLYPTVFI